ncbi:S8 family serine peptidase [Bacillus inaquosorum]|uniref:S8 family peptidase n=1 Tax=Bacillus inaquosorum TaxID=483913 RepID=UPI000A0FE53D|nr:S8 family serine peptidase [Bacillus inaquosorum]ARV43894.1 hypothetical protein BCV50_02270 [Bacillus subtilis]QJC88929.1 Cell wall-associated protease, WprA like [Bacillus subtilis]WNW24247.1 S8 family serine peptidase [Bacillus inaquosorum]
MERHYYARGKKVDIKELTDVLAVKLDEEDSSLAKELQQASAFIQARESENAEEQQIFQKAGWYFINPKAERSMSFDRSSTNVAVGRVFQQANGRTFIGNNLLTVKLKAELSEQDVLDLLSKNNLEIVNKLGFGKHLYEVKVSGERDFIDVANKLQKRTEFLFAEPQFIEQISSRYKPTDPNYNKQWQWKNNGSAECTTNADVHAEEAWDLTRGFGIRIAVIDNGFEVNHPDLKEAIVDGAGYFKKQGMGSTSFVNSLSQYPNESHGTFCAGIALARADNESGGCGIANEAEYMPIAVLPDQVGTQVTLARAVAYAADPSRENVNAAGADIISCSLGPNGAEWTLQSVLDDAIEFAVNKGRNGLGTSIFWAVSNGNFAVAHDEVCSHSKTMAVGRSNCQDKEDGSAFGPELDFLAPGVDVFSTDIGGSYSTSTGTSFAAPCAAGIGALVLSVNPNLNYQQVREVIRSTCDKIGGVSYDPNGHHQKYGYGRVNAISAVRKAQTQRSNVSETANESIKVGVAKD